MGERILDGFTREIGSATLPPFTGQLGDIVEEAPDGGARPVGILKRLADKFTGHMGRIAHVVGNHDIFCFPEAILCQEFGLPGAFYTFEVEAYRVIVLNSCDIRESDQRVAFSSRQLEWVKDVLQASNRPTVVLSHHPLGEVDLRGNVWFDGMPWQCLPQNRTVVRELFAEYGNVQLVLGGHIHANSCTLHEGIPYVTIQSATESIMEDDQPAQACAIVEMSKNLTRVTILGKDSELYEHVPRRAR
jgi:hypothetical protein